MLTQPGDPDLTSQPIRVLIADDHSLVREALANMLSDHEGIIVIGQASDGQAAVEQVEELQPDVVLMDVSMPRLNGIDAARQIAQRWPDVAIIGLSMHEDQQVADKMLKAGATAYVCKSGDPEELIEAIRKSAQN